MNQTEEALKHALAVMLSVRAGCPMRKTKLDAAIGLAELALAAPARLPSGVVELKEAAEELLKRQKPIESDVSSAHSGRGDGAAQWMREDDADFRRTLEKLFDRLRAAIAAVPMEGRSNGG